MRRRRGGILAESIIACFIAAIVTFSAASVLFYAGGMIFTAYDKYCIERAAGNLAARLSCGQAVDSQDESGCLVEKIEIADGIAKYRLSRSGMRGYVERYLLWPSSP